MLDFRRQLRRDRRDSGSWECFKRIEAGKYLLSIQGSEGAYCTPRCDFDDVYKYIKMEVALFTIDGAWAHPSTIKGLDSKFDKMWEPLDSGSNFVGPYIPVEDIQELFEFLCA